MQNVTNIFDYVLTKEYINIKEREKESPTLSLITLTCSWFVSYIKSPNGNYIILVYTRHKYCNLIGQPQVFIFISNLYGGYYIKYYGNAMLFASLN